MNRLKRFVNNILAKFIGVPSPRPARVVEQWQYDSTWTIRQLKREATGKGIKNVRIRTKQELIEGLNDRI